MPYTAAALLCLVVHVSDGDSLFTRCHASGSSIAWPEKVRIADIDAPELSQNFGRESKAHLEALCLGKEAEIATVTRDQYERLVAHVRCGGVDAASAQLQSGQAWLYTWRHKPIPAMQSLQDRAQAQRLGLWSEARPQAPWNYRKQHPPYSRE
ncbi:thermonuclease family protein [Diaphorobacter sp. HDW4A]|nr:thermonuclease family protein [Diaphorobacter sp. HDW4A]